MHFFKKIAFGVSMGCTTFVFVQLIGYWIIGHHFFEAISANFIQQVLGSMIIGIACALPAYIYQVERLTFVQQIAIHFTISISIFIIVAFSLNWIPPSSIGIILLMLLLSVLLFAIIWLLFYLYNISEAKRLNKKIQELIEKNSNI